MALCLAPSYLRDGLGLGARLRGCMATTLLRRFFEGGFSEDFAGGSQRVLLGVSRWSPFLKSIRVFSVVGLAANSD